MSDELALDEFIKEDKKNQKKTTNSSNNNSNNNNNHFKRNYNNNNNNNNNNNGNRNYFKRTNNSNKNNDNNNRSNNYQYNNNKEDRYDSRNDSNERVNNVKKVQRPIAKPRKDDNNNDHHHSSQSNSNTRQLQINATKKVTIPKKLYTVRVKNLPSSINSHEIYELASEKEQVKVESISTTFNCNTDSKLIEAEISYYHQSDANTFVQNYNEATLEDQILQVFLL